MIYGCVCSKCKKWHSHVYKDKNGKYVCINCYYNLKGGKEEDENI